MEQAFRKQREDELSAKRAEKERVEKERLEAIKQKEVQRITEERRRNEKPMDIVNGSLNLPDCFPKKILNKFNFHQVSQKNLQYSLPLL